MESLPLVSGAQPQPQNYASGQQQNYGSGSGQQQGYSQNQQQNYGQVQQQPYAPAPPVSTPSQAEIFSSLERLAQLHQSGVLSEDEFKTKKAELLSRL